MIQGDTYDLAQGIGRLRWGDALATAVAACAHALRTTTPEGEELAFPLERLSHAVEFKLGASALFTASGFERVTIAGRCAPGVDRGSMDRALAELAGIFGVGFVHPDRPRQKWRRGSLEIELVLNDVNFAWHVRRV